VTGCIILNTSHPQKDLERAPTRGLLAPGGGGVWGGPLGVVDDDHHEIRPLGVVVYRLHQPVHGGGQAQMMGDTKLQRSAPELFCNWLQFSTKKMFMVHSSKSVQPHTESKMMTQLIFRPQTSKHIGTKTDVFVDTPAGHGRA